MLDDLGINGPSLIAFSINFFLLLGLLTLVLYKPVTRMLDQRSAKIKESLEEAERIKQESVRAEEAVREQIEVGRREGQAIIAQAAQTGERVKEEARTGARKEAEVLIAKAQAEIARERRRLQPVASGICRSLHTCGREGYRTSPGQESTPATYRSGPGRRAYFQEELGKAREMAKGVSGRRHAQAVFEISLENNTLDEWQTDLEMMANVLGNPEVAALLENPKLDFGKKRQVLQSILPDVAPAAMNLACLLVAKNRLRILPGLLAEFRRLVNAYHGREEAEVITAVPIGDEERKKIETDLSAISGKEVMVSSRVDPDILGGLVARLGDKLIDGSIRTRLRELRRSLA